MSVLLLMSVERIYQSAITSTEMVVIKPVIILSTLARRFFTGSCFTIVTIDVDVESVCQQVKLSIALSNTGLLIVDGVYCLTG